MVAIGGIGGSGTRIVAQLFREAGYFLGDDLNKSNDNLLFTLLFKRQSILVASDTEFDLSWQIFKKVMERKGDLTKPEIELLKKLCSKDRTLHDREFLRERFNRINYDSQSLRPWAWKEPNTHIVIERIFKHEFNLQFIYVYRNPLDMAYSPNQFQIKLWGDIFLDQKNISISPKNSLKYWCLAYKRMENLKKAYPNKVFLLNFDNLSTDTDMFVRPLEIFLNTEIDLARHTGIIKTPNSIGRHKDHSLDCFDEEDINYIRAIEGLSAC